MEKPDVKGVFFIVLPEEFPSIRKINMEHICVIMGIGNLNNDYLWIKAYNSTFIDMYRYNKDDMLWCDVS